MVNTIVDCERASQQLGDHVAVITLGGRNLTISQFEETT